jgi:hypothetical protein
VTAVQPITALLKVHQGVKVAEAVVAMARQKACQTRDEVRLKAQKAYRSVSHSAE